MLSVLRMGCWAGHLKSKSFSTLLLPIYRLQSLKFATNSAATQPSTPKTAVSGYVKDVIIYKNDNSRFYKFLNLMCLAQVGFWGYLSAITLNMPDTPDKVTSDFQEDLPWWRKTNFGDGTLKRVLAAVYACVGWAVLGIGWFYIARSIRFLVLRKDGVTISFVTYSPLGRNRIMDVPLKCISAQGSRASKRSHIPIRIQNIKFYYILDAGGQFPQPLLFDQTVGTRRQFKNY